MDKKDVEKARRIFDNRYDLNKVLFADEKMVSVDLAEKEFALYNEEKPIARVSFRLVMKMAETLLKMFKDENQDNIIEFDDSKKVN